MGAPLCAHLSLRLMEKIIFHKFPADDERRRFGLEKFIAILRRVTLIQCVHYISSNQTARLPGQMETSEGNVLTNRDAI